MSLQPNFKVSPEEYLAIERKAEYRSEYYDGQMFAMAGASRLHNRIVTNLVSGLDPQLRPNNCNVYSSDMRVKIPVTGLQTYPDVVVTCGQEAFSDEHLDTLINPVVIIEVLSDSTEAYDRGKKFEHYQRLESLQEYLLIAQVQIRVERYTRQANNEWLYTEVHRPDGSINLLSISCELLMKDIYFNVMESA